MSIMPRTVSTASAPADTIATKFVTIAAFLRSVRSASTPNSGPKITMGKKLGERDQTDPELRLRQFPRQPALRNSLDPQAMQ